MKSSTDMTRRLSLLALGLVVSGCYQDIGWKKIVNGKAFPTHFTWRDSDELWGDGAAVGRRVDGAWELLDVCGDKGKRADGQGPRSGILVGFGPGKEVSALCGLNASEGQDLVHFDAAGHAEARALPNDGSLQLVQLVGDIALIGETQVFARDGAGWKSIATHDPLALQNSAGRTASDLYVATATNVLHFDGHAFTPVFDGLTQTGLVRVALRDGQLFADNGFDAFFRLDATGPVDLFKPTVNAKTGVRHLRPVAILAPDHLVLLGFAAHDMETAGQGGYLWLLGPGDDDATYLGAMPFYAAGGLYQGGNGSFGYAVDEDTYLGFSGDGLYEGTR
jgi:hypothetical protein